jgi:hypothetical protein
MPTETQNDRPKYDWFSPKSKRGSPSPTPCARGAGSGVTPDEAGGAEGVVDEPDIEGNEAIVSNDEHRCKVQKGYLGS